MSETNEHGTKIDEIMASIKEYTNEDINDLEAAKANIAEILKTHRPIKLADYQYGFCSKGKKDHVLYVKEINQNSFREYANHNDYWYCSFRRREANTCKTRCLEFKYGMVFAPIHHNFKCETRKYSFVMKYQNLLKQEKFDEAQRLKRRGGSLSIFDESNLSTTDMENDSILDQSVADDTNDNHDSNIILSESQITTSTSVEAVQELERSAVERDDTEYCIEIIQPPAKRPKLEPNYNETFSFNHPSANTLEKVCEKLNIKYRHDAYIFWAQMFYRRIPSLSENIKTHSFKTPNIFACFSQFFTGKTDGCFDILKNVNEAFRQDLISAGIKSNAEIEEICTNITVTDEHLEFIAKFLSCRIGIYENGNLKKFGKWESENNEALTLILSFENGFYSVVLDL